MYKVAALYEFSPVNSPDCLKLELERECRKREISGGLILAEEGINGTIAGSEENLDAILSILSETFNHMELKISYSEEEPFNRLRIRVKEEIVTMGLPLVSKDHDLTAPQKRGTYVDSKKWNELISSPDVVVLDTRNDYEVQIGTFQNSLNPNTKSFGEFPNFVKNNITDTTTKIAMFCTGGVRCEKASTFMKSVLGFQEVYHLKGGILKYLEDMPPEESRWSGSCFVFDRRASIDHGLQKGKHVFCFSCRTPLSSEVLVRIPNCRNVHLKSQFNYTRISHRKRRTTRT